MGLAFHPQPQGWVLNRYAHVYAMKPFMWLAGEPYVGARAYWCALFGVTVGALIWAPLQQTADRARVIALTLFLLAGQETLFAFPGVAWADYAIMAVITVASCFVLGRIAQGADLSERDAAALGMLFLVGFKAKEAVAPMLVLAGSLFISPSGRWRTDRTAKGLGLSWLAGMAVAMLGIIALDALFLRDPLFSLRPSSWGKLVAFNTEPRSYPPSDYSWLTFMLQPATFLAFALYLGAGLPWATRERDRRLLLVYALPAVFLLIMAVGGEFVAAPIIKRYTLPILPILCLLAALSFSSLVREQRGSRSGSLAPWLGLAVVSLLAAARTAAPDGTWTTTVARYAGPLSIFSGAIAYLLVRPRPRVAAVVATLAVVAGGAIPLVHVVDRLA